MDNSDIYSWLAQTAEVTAFDVVEAGARRVNRMFTPYISGRLMTLVHDIWPALTEYLLTSSTSHMKNMDS